MSSTTIAASPIKLGTKHTLSHRLVMAPMTRRQCGPNGIPTDKVVEHYCQRSKPSPTGFSMIISEGVFVNCKKNLVGETPTIPHIGNDEAIAGWKKVTDAMRATSGGKTLSAIQLWHTGRFAGMTSPPGAQSVGPCDDEYDLPAPASSSSTSTTNASAEQLKQLAPKAQVHGLTKEEIQELVQDYATAAYNSIYKAGFDAIEAHFAHGYLLDSFISPVLNKRTDEFGGENSLENRLRFPCMIIQAMRAAVGKDVPIILRTSQWSVMDYNAKNYRTPAELEFALQKFVEAGIDAIHISTRRVVDPGFPDDHPTRTLAGWASYFLKEKKSCGEEAANNVLVIGVGSVCVSRNFAGRQEYSMTGDAFELTDPTPALELLEKREIDVLAIGRAAISDAEICGKLLSGNWKEVKKYSPESIKSYP